MECPECKSENLLRTKPIDPNERSAFEEWMCQDCGFLTGCCVTFLPDEKDIDPKAECPVVAWFVAETNSDIINIAKYVEHGAKSVVDIRHSICDGRYPFGKMMKYEADWHIVMAMEKGAKLKYEYENGCADD